MQGQDSWQEIINTLEEAYCNDTEIKYDLTKHCKWNFTNTTDIPFRIITNTKKNKTRMETKECENVQPENKVK